MFVLKAVSNGKPTMDTMRQSLEALKENCQRFRVTKLAIPHIGCGLDRLIWPQVRSLIIEIFSDSGIVIHAYDFNAVSMLVSVLLMHAFIFAEECSSRDKRLYMLISFLALILDLRCEVGLLLFQQIMEKFPTISCEKGT